MATHSRSVLVVDDEELMREVTSIMVEENGYKSLTAANGRNAIEVLKDNLNDVELVVLDFSMPGLDGYETFKALKGIKPDIKAVMVSGLRAIPEINELIKNGEIKFLSKPFHEKDLIDILKKLESDQAK